MVWQQYILVLVFTLSALVSISTVEEPRKALTANVAVAVVLIAALIILLIASI